MSKAYDRIEWKYLEEANVQHQIEGFQVCRGAPKLNHLLFADDSILFCRANMQSCLVLQHRLDIYEKAFGQKVNREKTSMVFSHNVPSGPRREIMQCWGVNHFQQYEKYLGLPPMVGRGKYQAFSVLKHQVWSKLQGWKEKLLSQGGKEVLLKAVALSIPIYTMSYFKLPKSLCAELESLMASFWWGQKQDERKLSWISWKRMCESKMEGGMEFRSIQMFNKALLAKQGWRIMHEESSLLHKIFKARYFPTSSFFDSRLGVNPSYVWRGIWDTKNSLLKGCRWRVGNGLSINIWSDYWLPKHKLLSMVVDIPPEARLQKVSSLMTPEQNSWDVERVRSVLPPREATKVLSIRLPMDNILDMLIWEHETSGIFSVKSAYEFFKTIEQNGDVAESSRAEDEKLLWKHLWKMHVPQRVKVFAWRMYKNILPTFQNLKTRRVIQEATCYCCQTEE
ncbi:hypothetical protein I3843_09G118400 [Carya illinoinensis]|nr:hypothetical protein I3843_09G118400 [Carya illinoinensis]